MTIGDALAAERRQAGLTITQVSQRTCIRETIIRGIEQDDFSACGGDFYARGHIRSIARAVGTEPEPLIREYDATQRAPEGITAADVFEPSTPIRLRERRRPNWSLAMLVALAAIVGIATYHFLSSPTKTSPAAATHRAAASPGPGQSAGNGHAVTGHKKKRKTTSQAIAGDPHHVVIALRTAGESCWVDLTTHTGRVIFAGTLSARTSKTWTEEGPVRLDIGNPGTVHLTVNGQNQTPRAGSPVILTLGAAASATPTQG